jgi:hypothetical protein
MRRPLADEDATMTSDPFKLMTERTFRELREDARRHRMARSVRTTPRRGPVVTLSRIADRLAGAVGSKRRTVPGWVTGDDVPAPAASVPTLPLEAGARLRALGRLDGEHVFRDDGGAPCCVVDASDRAAAARLHREAHALIELRPVRRHLALPVRAHPERS